MSSFWWTTKPDGHFSRLTLKDWDLLCGPDPSRRGLAAAAAIADLLRSLPMGVAKPGWSSSG